MYKLNNELRRLAMKQMKTADPVNYIRFLSRKIKDHTINIQLPKLSISDINSMKKHLIEFQKITGNELKYKFLNLRNALLIINELEEDEELKYKIQPIIHYLTHYKPVIDLIIQNQGREKEDSKLTLAIQLLNFEMTVFISKYHRLLIDIDTTEFTTKTTTLKSHQIEKIIEEEDEEVIIPTLEEYEETTSEEEIIEDYIEEEYSDETN